MSSRLICGILRLRLRRAVRLIIKWNIPPAIGWISFPRDLVSVIPERRTPLRDQNGSEGDYYFLSLQNKLRLWKDDHRKECWRLG